jgi:hypothetical protein
VRVSTESDAHKHADSRHFHAATVATRPSGILLKPPIMTADSALGCAHLCFWLRDSTGEIESLRLGASRVGVRWKEARDDLAARNAGMNGTRE